MRSIFIIACVWIVSLAVAAPSPDPKLGEEVDGPYDVTLRLGKAGAQQCVLLDWQNGQGLLVSFTPSKTLLESVGRQGRAVLASGAACAGKELRLRRRLPDVVVLAGGKTVLRGYDNRSIRGMAAPAAGTKVSDFTVQPVEPVEFHEDYFDPNREASQWEPVSGKWAITEYRDPLVSIQDGPVGAAWYQCEVDGKAVALTGENFWDSYRASVKVQAVPGVAAGLTFGGGQVCALKLVSETEAEVVCGTRKARIRCRAGNWYLLTVQPGATGLECLVNGKTALTLAGTPPSGKAGVYAEGKGQAKFDDFAVTAVRDVRDEPAGTKLQACWQASGGKWEYDGKHRLNASAPGGGTLLRVLDFAPGYVAGTVEPREGFAGLVLDWNGRSGYRLGVNPQGSYSLARVDNGKSTTLLSGRCKLPAALRLSRQEGRLEAQVGQERQVAYNFACEAGKSGYFASGKAVLDGFSTGPGTEQQTVISMVTGVPTPMPGENDDSQRFVLGYVWQPLGGTWSGLEQEGEKRLAARPYAQQPAALWYREECPGEAVMRLEGLQAGKDAAAGVAVGCERREPASGYRAEVQGQKLRLYRLEKLVAEKVLTEAPQELRLWRDGKHVAAMAGEQGVSFADEQPLPGSLCAAYATGGEMSVDQVVLAHRNADYYAFKAEEVDWQPVSGEWMTHSGMACIPWDYWYTAHGNPEAALAFDEQPQPADLHLSLWVSEYSEGYPTKEHKHFPYHDISLVTSATAGEADSGYRFVIGGEGGTVARLLRKGQLVAETRDPRFAIVMGAHCNTPREVHLVVHQEKGRLSLEFNGTKCLEYTDPQPLPGGLVGLGAACHAANFRDLCVVRLGN